MKALIFFLLLMVGAPLTAQVRPISTSSEPAVFNVRYEPNFTLNLAIHPNQPLTVILAASDPIREVTVSRESSFQIEVLPDRSSLMVVPLSQQAAATVRVYTQNRDYRFDLVAQPAAPAVNLVRMVYEDQPQVQPALAIVPSPAPPEQGWAYRVKGDRSVRPAAISDDGWRTYIEYAANQMLPAVFAIGPTGNEEVVDGYMRDGVFVIDRVHARLVFRIDKDKATAIRQEHED